MPLARPGVWGEYAVDEKAGDQSALKLFGTHYEWCVQFHPFRSLETNGKTWRVRARVRIDPRSPEGEAFWAGIYDPVTRRDVAGISVSAKEANGTYRWFTVAEHWKPAPDDFIWMGPGRFGKGKPSAISAVYLDCIECTEE